MYLFNYSLSKSDELIKRLMEQNREKYPYKIGDRVVLKGTNRCATITDLKYNSCGNLSYYIKIDNDKDISIDCPTELLLPYNNRIKKLMENKLNKDMKETWCCPEGYEFDENGNIINATKIVLEKKKKEYPKTYEECCMVLQDACMTHKGGYKSNLIQTLQKLLICRDAYWKIAGEEMGLGKPWEPYYTNTMVLSFPTEEMRDAFYENFKSEIESCKELL